MKSYPVVAITHRTCVAHTAYSITAACPTVVYRLGSQPLRPTFPLRPSHARLSYSRLSHSRQVVHPRADYPTVDCPGVGYLRVDCPKTSAPSVILCRKKRSTCQRRHAGTTGMPWGFTHTEPSAPLRAPLCFDWPRMTTYLKSSR